MQESVGGKESIKEKEQALCKFSKDKWSLNLIVLVFRIVEFENGRVYIPDTNNRNILALDGIWPPPEASEVKKGYMLRAVGPGGQKTEAIHLL